MDTPPEPPPSPEQIIEQRLVDCGLDAHGLSVRYEDGLQSLEIVIASSAGATSKHFACIKEAAEHEIVTFEDGGMYSAYSKFTTELARPEMLAGSEKALKEAGLYEGFPEREAFETLEEYAVALEKHAGANPGSALRVSGDGILFDPPRDAASYADFEDRYSNLIAVVAYASIRDRVGFGFIGNGAIAE